MFHLPASPQRNPIEPVGTTTSPLSFIDADRLPFRIVLLAEPAHEVGGADEAARNVGIATLLEPDQERHVGVAPQ